METISFYSYKGGVGRSLALTNLGVYLAQFGVSVAMVDFDLEAPGLTYKLQPGRSVPVPNRGLAGLLADISRGVSVESAEYDLAIDVTDLAVADVDEDDGLTDEVPAPPRGRLLLVPAGNPLTPEYWRDLAAIEWEQLFTGNTKPGVAALSVLKEKLIDAYQPDVLLVDSRTGITPGGGVSTTLLPDAVVVLLLNSPEHLDGSRMVVAAATQSGGKCPRVVPVLSRYTSAVARPRVVRSRYGGVGAIENSDERDLRQPLDDIYESLTVGLPPEAGARVSQPLVLHSDSALQRSERLAFGRFAGADPDRGQKPLLEDYLRLFAELVPQSMILEHTAGVRRRARAMLLDRPDDAIRTLEGLLTFVGDEAVFSDLVKIYALRRDVSSMVTVSNRVFRVHGTVLFHPDLTEALRDISTDSRGAVRLRNAAEASARFLEAYWRNAARDDLEWGAGVALVYTNENDHVEAERLADEIVTSDPSAEAYSQVVLLIAQGNPGAERLALRYVTQGLDLGFDAPNFVRAATVAIKYQEDRKLAGRLLQSPGASALTVPRALDLMRIAGKLEEAGGILVEALSPMTPGDDDVEPFLESWRDLSRKNRSVRLELTTLNPALVEFLDNRRGDDE